jgi:hypothetical protein
MAAVVVLAPLLAFFFLRDGRRFSTRRPCRCVFERTLFDRARRRLRFSGLWAGLIDTIFLRLDWRSSGSGAFTQSAGRVLAWVHSSARSSICVIVLVAAMISQQSVGGAQPWRSYSCGCDDIEFRQSCWRVRTR